MTNTVDIILILSETGLKIFKKTPTFSRLLYDNQLAALKPGKNFLTVTHTIWGKLQNLTHTQKVYMSVQKVDNI